MNRLLPLALGAAAGALLAAVFLSRAVASADDDYTLIAQDPEVVTGISGFAPLYQEVVGTDVFAAEQSNPAITFGTFNADVTTLTTSWGVENQEIVVTGGQLGVLTVPTGSVFDLTNFGFGFENEYSDVIGVPNTITDVFVTPFGDFNIPTAFDAIASLIDMPGAIIP
jgi:hypothetical protein